MELTKQECDTLIEAVDCWVRKDFSEGLFGAVLGSMIPKGSEAEAQWKEEQKADEVKRETAKKLRKEQAIMLKAKLLKIRVSHE
jgi:hypothetical protein